ncbi:MAG: peptidylprolyl isomerase [Candidatus Brocadiia bacterium]
MAEAKVGDTVKVHYTAKLKDGTVFDTSEEREPLTFTLGEGQVIPGVEQAVLGMNPGESKTASVAAEEAYGQYRDDMVLVVNREKLPEGMEPEVGQQLQVRHGDGQSTDVRITQVTDEEVTLDGNHPLAGRDVDFELQLVDIV